MLAVQNENSNVSAISAIPPILLNLLSLLGMCQVHITVGGVTKQLPLVVCKGSGLSLLGRNWLEELKLNWQEIARINGVTKIV